MTKRMKLSAAEVAVIERLRQDASHFNDGLDAAIEALKALPWGNQGSMFTQCEQAINTHRKEVL